MVHGGSRSQNTVHCESTTCEERRGGVNSRKFLDYGIGGCRFRHFLTRDPTVPRGGDSVRRMLGSERVTATDRFDRMALIVASAKRRKGSRLSSDLTEGLC